MDGRRITVGGVTYGLRAWAYKDGKRWAWRLMRIASLAGDVSASAMADLMDGLGEAHFEELAALCEKYTDVISADDGIERVLPLSQVAATHMQGRYLDLAMVMRGHLEAEFADFFAGLGAVLAVSKVADTSS